MLRLMSLLGALIVRIIIYSNCVIVIWIRTKVGISPMSMIILIMTFLLIILSKFWKILMKIVKMIIKHLS